VKIADDPFRERVIKKVSMWVATLSGDEIVLAPTGTLARGVRVFRLTEYGLGYELMVANSENITQAHIHLTTEGANGANLAWLYPGGPPPQLIQGRFDGVLAEGTITRDDPVDPLAGQELDALLALEKIEAGNAFFTSTRPNTPRER